MKKIAKTTFLLWVIFLFSVGTALASTYTTYTMPSSLSLSHGSAYSWAVPIGNLPEGETIIGATLVIDNLRNDYYGSMFYTHLMDYAPGGGTQINTG